MFHRSKTFDRVSLSDITDIMKETDIPEEIEALNSNTKIQILINNTLMEEMSVLTGVRQRETP